MDNFSDFFTKGPVVRGWELTLDKIKEGAADLAISYIDALPIMLGVSIGVYALINMFSKPLAKLGVMAVFLYGGVIILA